jgi:hypothetical protein
MAREAANEARQEIMARLRLKKYYVYNACALVQQQLQQGSIECTNDVLSCHPVSHIASVWQCSC